MPNAEQKKNRTFSPEAFRNFLEWLDEGTDSAGQNYLKIRDRLIAYFDRKNCLEVDELADETLNRTARRLAEEKEIITETPAKFCYIQARFVFLEYLRRREKNNVPLDENFEKSAPDKSLADENEEHEKRLDCLEKCVGQLNAENREMIVGYYYGEERAKIENRRNLAEKLGISQNALTIRACRVREKLEKCVRQCVGEK